MRKIVPAKQIRVGAHNQLSRPHQAKTNIGQSSKQSRFTSLGIGSDVGEIRTAPKFLGASSRSLRKPLLEDIAATKDLVGGRT
jgi:hypothetical protein